jgi:hypothetical protein
MVGSMAPTLMMPCYEDAADSSSRAQATASRDWIHSRMDGDILAVLIFIGSVILFVALSNEPLLAFGGCIVALVVFLTGRALHYILTVRS